MSDVLIGVGVFLHHVLFAEQHDTKPSNIHQNPTESVGFVAFWKKLSLNVSGFVLSSEVNFHDQMINTYRNFSFYYFNSVIKAN